MKWTCSAASPTASRRPARRRSKAMRCYAPRSDGAPLPIQNTYTAGLTASYEVDLFGRVADSVKAAGAQAQQSDALLRSEIGRRAAADPEYLHGRPDSVV